MYVSIHAPTRGATHIKHIGLMRCRFQSTHPHGVRQDKDGEPYYANTFQSTHPHGVRPEIIERDLAALSVSIHAPTRGATLPNSSTCFCNDVSIHAPTRGATTYAHKDIAFNFGFNPRTHTGCDSLVKILFFGFHSFNPRTHTGCDIITPVKYTSTLSFNPRTHTGCDVSTPHF